MYINKWIDTVLSCHSLLCCCTKFILFCSYQTLTYNFIRMISFAQLYLTLLMLFCQWRRGSSLLSGFPGVVRWCAPLTSREAYWHSSLTTQATFSLLVGKVVLSECLLNGPHSLSILSFIGTMHCGRPGNLSCPFVKSGHFEQGWRWFSHQGIDSSLQIGRDS